jgi:hypothetical protein
MEGIMSKVSLYLVAAAALPLALGACGGGGGGGGVESIPPPPPPPPPPGNGPLPPDHLALVSSQPFAALGVSDGYTTDASGNNPQVLSGPAAANVQFSFDAATNTYQISLPGFQAGRLANPGYDGSEGQVATGSTSQVTVGSSATLQPVFVTLPVPGSEFSPYTYTSFGSWNGQTGQTADGRIIRSEGAFAYGIPTQPGDVPTTGSASYTAEIKATLGPSDGFFGFVGGDVNLLFDFGAGKLSGSMHPRISDSFDGIFVDYGQYDFKDTVYSTGSTTFSGKFVVPGLPDADSFFDGNFTGPNAAELMARFEVPYLRGGQQGTISGVWVGKKH